MSRKFRMLSRCLGAALLASTPVALSPGLAHEDATGVVKERMEVMERYEELIERVFAMMNGELPHDPPSIRRAAQEIRDTAGARLTALFPEGSDGAPSEARPEIWRDFDQFSHMAEMLGSWADVLAETADMPPEGTLPRKWEDAEMGPGMMGRGMMGRGMMRGGMGGGRSGDAVFAAWHVAAICNTCHDDYREED